MLLKFYQRWDAPPQYTFRHGWANWHPPLTISYCWAPLFPWVFNTFGQKSTDTVTKLIIDLCPRVSWLTFICLNVVLFMDKYSNARTVLGFRSFRFVFPVAALQFYCHCPDKHWSPPVGQWSLQLGPLPSPYSRLQETTRNSELLFGALQSGPVLFCFLHWGKPQFAGTKLGRYKYTHLCPTLPCPITEGNSRVD